MRSKGRKKKRKGGVQHSGELLRQVRDLLAESLVAEAEGGAGDAPPLDADEIADLLRERNSAYGRQKRITFVSMVRSALAALRKGEGADSGDGMGFFFFFFFFFFRFCLVFVFIEWFLTPLLYSHPRFSQPQMPTAHARFHRR